MVIPCWQAWLLLESLLITKDRARGKKNRAMPEGSTFRTLFHSMQRYACALTAQGEDMDERKALISRRELLEMLQACEIRDPHPQRGPIRTVVRSPIRSAARSAQ